MAIMLRRIMVLIETIDHEVSAGKFWLRLNLSIRRFEENSMGIFAWSHFNERAAAVIVDDVVVPIDAGLIKLARKDSTSQISGGFLHIR